MHFARGSAAPLATPAIASAARTSTTTSIPTGRYGPSGTRTETRASLAVTLTAPPPEGAWALLLYVGPDDGRPRSAVHSVRVGPTTTFGFSEGGGGGGRCAPRLSWGTVPVGGAPVGVAWLAASGRLSPQSARVPVTEAE